MKTFNYKFRSIKSQIVEKENRVTKKTVTRLEFDRESIEQHELKVTLKDIFSHKSWIINFFLASMIMIPIASLIYAILKIGLKINFTHTSHLIFIILNSSLFIIIWSAIAIPSSIKNLKKDFVQNLRGKGNWKIIDEDKWDKFFKLLNISQTEDNKI